MKKTLLLTIICLLGLFGTLKAQTEETTVPAAPVIVAEQAGGSIIIAWEAVEGADYYSLYYQGEKMGNVEETYTSVDIPSIGEYCFNVTASNEAGESELSNQACVTAELPEDLEIPAAPSLDAKVENDSIVLSWEPVETATYYIVYFEGVVSGMVGKDITRVALYPSMPETYCFTVTAVNLAGESEHSNEDCVTYPSDAIAENETAFNIYPNPVKDMLFIETETAVEEVSIYDVYGRQQVTKTPSHQGEVAVDVTDLNSGVYFVKVRTEKGETVKRFVKE